MRPRFRLLRHPAVFLTFLAVVTFALVVAAQWRPSATVDASLEVRSFADIVKNSI